MTSGGGNMYDCHFPKDKNTEFYLLMQVVHDTTTEFSLQRQLICLSLAYI